MWGHCPALPFLKYYSWEKSNRDGVELAKAHIALLRRLDYKMDLLKVTPFYRFMGYHWGSKYQFIDNNEDQINRDVIVKSPNDWDKLWVLDPKKELREYIRSVSVLSREVGERIPFIYSIPSPLVQAIHHVSTPDRVYNDMINNRNSLEEGLEIITDTCIEFCRACISEGAAGIFFGIGSSGSYWSKMNRDQLRDYALKYDKKVLDTLKNVPIKLLHICSDTKENPQSNGGLMEEGWFKQYPVNSINWWDADFTPCSVAKKIYGDKFCIIAGVDHYKTLRLGRPEQVEENVRQSIESTAAGGGFIIGPGCTISQNTPLDNLNAVGRAVEKYGKYKK